MPVYVCRTIDPNGRRREIVREAPTKESLMRELSADALYPVCVSEANPKGRRPQSRRYGRGAILELLSALSSMLTGGLSLRDSLLIAQRIFVKGEANEMVVSLLEEIGRGETLSEAFERLGPSLPPIVGGLVRVGERLGSLEKVFPRLTEHLQEEKRLRDRIGGALLYPGLIVGVAAAGIGGIAFGVLPRVEAILGEVGAGLPERIGRSVLVLKALAAAGLGLIAACAAAWAFLVVERRRRAPMLAAVDRALLRVPLLGDFLRLRESVGLLFALETLTAGGYAVEDALLEASRVVRNEALREALLRARERVVRGESLSRALLEDRLFPEQLGRWTAVGESAGNVEALFGQLRRATQGDLERWTARFLSLFEPVLILLVGLGIFLVILLFVMPIFTVYGEVV